MNPIVLLLGLGALALALAGKSKTAPAKKPGTGKYDPGMDLDTERTVDAMLATDNDPNELREMALSLRPEFPHAADLLDTKANALAVNPGVPPVLVIPSPPIPVQPPAPPISPQPPVFIPPAPPPAIPPSPPIMPSQPPSPIPPVPSTAMVFNPGLVPASIRPIAPTAKTSQHQDIQRALSNFFAFNPVVYPDNADAFDPGFTLRDPSTGLFNNQLDADGVFGPKSELSLWAFQMWANAARNAGLAIDGLPGPASYAALNDWM